MKQPPSQEQEPPQAPELARKFQIRALQAVGVPLLKIRISILNKPS